MNDLVDLYDRDPLSLTEQDLDEIIRRQRESFAAYQAGTKGPTAPTKAKKTKDVEGAKSLLDDLGL